MVKRKKPEITNETDSETDNETNETGNETGGKETLKMTDEEMIADFVNEAKERITALAEKVPSIAIPEDEEIGKAVILRFKRGLSAEGIAKRLHRDKRVINAIVSPIPRRIDPSYPIQDWETEMAEEMANVPPISPQAPPRESVLPSPSPDPLEIQRAALKMIYGKRPVLPASSQTTGLTVVVSLSSETVARLYSLALMNGSPDVDMWINDTLIPWYMTIEQIKRDFNMVQGQKIDPKEFYEFFQIILRENAVLRNAFANFQAHFQEVAKNVPMPVLQGVKTG
jgi:hypothetical protein